MLRFWGSRTLARPAEHVARVCRSVTDGVSSYTSDVKERVGVFGGTFDPVHVGHVTAAVDVRDALDLDRVLLVPAGEPWQKASRSVSERDVRVDMADLACADLVGIEVSRIEIDRDGPSVTADTLEALGAVDRELFLILGADAAANMSTWERLPETRLLCTVVVVTRDGETADPPGDDWKWEQVHVPRLDVSSSDLRNRIANGRPIDGLVPAPVVQFILEHDLYTST